MLGFQPLNANLHQPASGKAASLNTCQTRRFQSFVGRLVYCLFHHGNIVLSFQIIANHCHLSTLYDVLKLSF